MSPRAIIEYATKYDLIPSHLYGETQHKTLQARLSTDILERRETGLFFRTKPGHFFLREFLKDLTIPEEYRQPITARRRTRDLIKGMALCVQRTELESAVGDDTILDSYELFDRVDDCCFSYQSAKHTPSEFIPVWVLGIVRRNNSVLCYRNGRYREAHDAFRHKRTLTFSTLVNANDISLFENGRFGIEEGALSAVSTDLDISTSYGSGGLLDFTTCALFSIVKETETKSKVVLTFVEISPPDWFEPVTRRLSLNDLQWLSLSPSPNNLEDFDPWSQTLFDYFYSGPAAGSDANDLREKAAEPSRTRSRAS